MIEFGRSVASIGVEIELIECLELVSRFALCPVAPWLQVDLGVVEAAESLEAEDVAERCFASAYEP